MTVTKPKPAQTAATSGNSLKQRLQSVSGVRRGKDPAPEIVTAKGRKGRRSVAIYMQPIAKEQLDRIAHEQDKTIQELGVEALNLLFRHYDLKPIA